MAGENPPVPDPTVLTTEQLLREIHSLKELTQVGLRLQEEVCGEKFKSMAGQFVLVERQRVEQKEDTKAAVDAAFSAAKEAVKEQTNASDRAIAKSEAATSKQLEQLSTTFTTALHAVGDSLSDLKDRVQAIESVKQGGREATTDRRESLAGTYGLIGAVAGALGIVGILAAAGVFG